MSDTDIKNQLNAIHTMLWQGQQSVRMERHTFILWGISAALLIILLDLFLDPQNFKQHWHYVLVETLIISIVLFIAGWWDFRLTHKIRQQRDETLSFIQTQLTKVWWFLVGLIVIINIGMNFFGGGYIFYPLVLIILGLAFYINGLFSRQMLCWHGVALIILGLIALALQPQYDLLKVLAASTLGLGFPLLPILLAREHWSNTWVKRLLVTSAWLMVIIMPVGLIGALITPSGDYPIISLENYRLKPLAPDQVENVRLPAGLKVPIVLHIEGNMIKETHTTILLALEKTIDIAVKNEKPIGFFHIEGEDWKAYSADFRLRVDKLETSLSHEQGPKITVKMRLSSQK